MKPSHLKLVTPDFNVNRNESTAGRIPANDTGQRIQYMALDQFNQHSFKAMLDSVRPSMIIETREYPGFFGIYNDMSHARGDFTRRSVKYTVIAMTGTKDREKQLDFIKRINEAKALFLKDHGESVLIVLFSTQYMLNIFKRTGVQLMLVDS